MDNATGKAFDFKSFKRILGYARPYKGMLWISLTLSILLAGFAPLVPVLTKFTLDKTIPAKNTSLLLIMSTLLFIFLFIRGAIQFLNAWYTNVLGQNIIRDLRIELYSHVLDMKLRFFDNTPLGTLVTRVISDIETIADIFSEGLIVLLNQLLSVIVVIVFMFVADVHLALLSLSVIPVLVFATWLFQKATRISFQEVRTAVAKLNGFIQEHISGMFLVQVFNREEIEMERFRQINDEHKVANIKSIWYYSIFFPVVEFLSAISLALIVWWGGKDIMTHTQSFGTIVEFVMFINLLFTPIRQISDKFNTMQMGVVSSERIFRLMDNKSIISDEGKIKAGELNGEIIFKDVWFAYNEGDWVLKNVSLTVKAGQTIALVGATGAGKSSIINILGRFYEFQRGSILIDGVDIRDYEIDSLRRNMAIVLQDVFLFSDSIFNNVALFNEDINLKQIEMAASIIGADEFIDTLPGKYNYNVRERGTMISAGQRQLISFIRAYVQNPPILILDEATSSIDSHTEKLIQKATEKLTERRTSLIIAHRLATVTKADKIIVLEKGEVVEEGTHAELIKKDGFYKQLYTIQFLHEEELRA